MVIQITKRGLTNVIFRHKLALLLIFAIAVSAGALYCALAPKIYRSEADVVVKFADSTSAADSGSLNIRASQEERREVVNTFVKILASQDLLAETLAEVGVNSLYPGLIADGNSDASVIDRGAAQLSRDLKAATDRDSDVIEISLNNRNAEMAASALGILIHRFIDRQTSLYSASQSTFMQEQVKEAHERLVQSQRQLDQFVATFGISSLEDERTALLRLEMETRSSLAQQLSRVAETQSRFAAVTTDFGKLKPVIELSDENDRYRGVDDARARLSDLNARRAELHNYRPDGLTMKTLDDQIEEAKQDLDARTRESAARVRTGPNPVYQQTQADLMRADAEMRGASAAAVPLQQQLDKITARLSELSSKEAEYHTLLLQRDADEESYRTFLQKADEARVSDSLRSQNVTGVAVVQKPTVPISPAFPRVRLIIAIMAVLGVGCGMIACLALEMMDETFSLPDQIEPVLGLPVIGTFPKIEAARYAG